MPKTKGIRPTKLHRALHLQHHHHTGKLLHHRHTSFRGLAIILLVAGVFIVGLGMLSRATADELVVYARNPAPIPTGPAVITNPTEGETVTKSTVIVEGTCPVITPRVLVVILNDGQQAASVACDSNNTFSVPIVVNPGLHTLVARTYTITGDAGPDSTPVHFVYTAPTAVKSEAAAQAEAEAASGQPLEVHSDEPFITFGPAKDAIWSGTITGGTLPYKVHIEWGDGTSDDYAIDKSGHQEFSHHYTAMHSYLIMLHVTDAEGRGVIQYYAAVTPYVGPAPNTLLPTRPTLPPFQGSVPLGIYGVYLALLSIFGLLWAVLHPAFAFVPIHISPSGARSSHFFLIAAKRRRKKDKKKQ